MNRIAITRDVSSAVERCELTHLERRPIDFDLAVKQHHLYRECLEGLGCRVISIEGADDLPDCVFVEDTALVLDEVAVLTRPGAASRRPEVPAIAAALEPFRPQLEIEAPGTLDGGDVLRIDRVIYIGRSPRSNDAGIRQLGDLLRDYDYEVRPVDFQGCLHLKSAVTWVGERMLLLNPDWVDAVNFGRCDVIEVDPAEPNGGNALPVGGSVVYASAYERTRERLEAHGVTVQTVDQSELTKAEAGVTCCSLIFES